MEAESFFARWSKRNAEAAAEKSALQADAPPQEAALPPPSLDEVALLTPDSDFKRFVAPGVDEAVRRSAMKKLFADPRFNVMDGLDVYIEDYHSFTPIPAAMLAALNHAKQLLDPLAQIESQLKKLVDADPEHDASDDTSEHNGLPAEEQIRHDDPVQGM
jgi:hypothetical protein